MLTPGECFGRNDVCLFWIFIQMKITVFYMIAESGVNNLLLKAGSLKLGLRGLILEKKSYFWAEICHSVVDWPGRARMKYWEPWLFMRELLYRLSLHFRNSPFLLSQHCNCIRTAGKVLLCTIDFHCIPRKTEGPRVYSRYIGSSSRGIQPTFLTL